MSTGKERPTWVLLPENKLLSGSRALSLLGCIVADVQNPTDDYAPHDISALRADATLPAVQQFTTTDNRTQLAKGGNSAASFRLSKILTASRKTNTGGAQSLASTNIITRFLENHPDFFRRLMANESYKAEIERMYHSRTRTKKMNVAYMVVGVKTCLNARIENLTTLSSSVEVGLELPIGEIIQQLAGSSNQTGPGDDVSGSGVTAALEALNIGTDAYRNTVSGLFTSFTASGEQVFAIQYREIKKYKAWLSGTESYQAEALHGTCGPGLFGGHKEQGENPESESDDGDSENGALENSQIGKPQAATGESSTARMHEETTPLAKGKLEKAVGQAESSEDKHSPEEAKPSDEVNPTDKAEPAEEEEVSKQGRLPASKDKGSTEEEYIEEAKSTDKMGTTKGEKVPEQGDDAVLENLSEQDMQKSAWPRASTGDESEGYHVADDEFELGPGLPLGQIGELVVVNFL